MVGVYEIDPALGIVFETRLLSTEVVTILFGLTILVIETDEESSDSGIEVVYVKEDVCIP